jgi:glycosyltransferase involved in cell wall biosynthesis
MDWMPNIDAAKWFAQEILPLIRIRRPGVTVAFAGRNPAPDVIALASSVPGFVVTGTVPDIRPWLHGARLSIVPLRIGGGTRLKIYEAMAAGCPVVSTTVGAEGLDCTNGENIILADTAEDFAAACVKILDNPDERSRIGKAAREFVIGGYSWANAAGLFEKALFS